MKKNNRVTGIGRDYKKCEKDDFFPTPREAIDALLDREIFEGAVFEPAAGEGHISVRLMARGYDVISTDLVDRGFCEAKIDFLMEYKPRAPNILTNPPFKLADDFIKKALQLADKKVAMFLPLSYLSGQARKKEIFDIEPPARVYVFSWRVQLKRAGWDGGQGGGGMMNFCWMVWDKDHKGPTEIHWI